MPTRGTTRLQFYNLHCNRFQSTCPRGARLGDREPETRALYISIHVPTRGTTMREVDLDDVTNISIHVPTRGTTLKLIISLFFYKYFLYVVPKFMIYLKFGSSASSRTRPFTMNTALESGRSRTSREIDVHSHFA